MFYIESDLIDLDGYNDMIEDLGGAPPTDKEIWDILRLDCDVPNIANVILRISLDKIMYLMSRLHPKVVVTYVINLRKTCLRYDNEEIGSIIDHYSFLEELGSK